MVVLNYSIGYNEHLLDGKVFFNRANLRSLIRQRSKNKIGDNENLFRSRMIHLNMAFENQHSSERFEEKQSNTIMGKWMRQFEGQGSAEKISGMSSQTQRGQII